MSIDINQAVRLKSLIFWSDKMSKLDDLVGYKKYWIRRDYAGFMKAWEGECPMCSRQGRGPTWDPETTDGGPAMVRDVLIDRVQCFCMTLKYISDRASRWYESPYQDRYLSDISPIDIPQGAAKQTKDVVCWIEKFYDHPARFALIYGKTGCGKSHMMHAIKTHFGRFATYLTLSDFRSKLIAYAFEGSDVSVTEFIDKLTWTPILLLDDFGSESQKDFNMDSLWTIINARYERGRYGSTIMTTNLPMADMVARLKGGSIGVTERILSRMLDTGTSRVLWVSQDDYRLKPTKKAAGIKVTEDF